MFVCGEFGLHELVSSGRTVAIFFIYTIFSLSLAGCVVGPTFQAPDMPAGIGYDLPAHDGRFSICEKVDLSKCGRKPQISGWWDIYRSDVLNIVVASALSGNLTIEALHDRLQQAQEQKIAAGESSILNLDLNAATSSRSFSVAPFRGNSASARHLFIGAGISISPDLYGAGYSRSQAQVSSIEQTVQQVEAERLAIEESLVATLIDVASAEAALASLNKIKDIDERRLKIETYMVSVGRLSRQELLKYQNVIENDQSKINEERYRYKTNLIEFAALSGIDPSHAKLAELPFDDLHPKFNSPPTVSSKQIFRRADIQGSLAALKKANAEVGIANANLYPNVTISADSLFILSADFSIPLFHWQALQAQLSGSQLAKQEALANYRQTVVGAFSDVAKNLMALSEDRREIGLLESLVAQSRDALRANQKMQKIGRISKLYVLESARDNLNLKLKLMAAKTKLYVDIAHFQTSIGSNVSSAVN